MVKSLGYGIGEIIKCFALLKNSTKINDQNCGRRVAFNKNFTGGRRYLQPPPPPPSQTHVWYLYFFKISFLSSSR
jgi:hypothetical protein